ncbi:hypothetical protein CAOG_08616 [Capsaspora owczarzaki ATCC 30864]|uniref:hypothetical protein n=1 Tax=Capsaspora owczarzaki (strain ATCC 30864) TaxID=595528 RepID=UPI0001FE6912|nr:hypothetical protein CAOG_08616 [Capsaspora owczarzaki ATCC 30864]|eukprot:XP_011270216.1 hypothetical protein CAOG_08616 [Capsaspora owczarzaki ATCC 30864]
MSTQTKASSLLGLNAIVAGSGLLQDAGFLITDKPQRESRPGRPVVCAHDGTFHCDEALACFMLKLTDKFANADIVRTRVPAVLAEADCCVDVGAVDDPSTHRYDHHQASFKGTFSPAYKSRLSSAGLVYKHHGREVIRKIVAGVISPEHPELEAQTAVLYERVYKQFIEHIDAMDNGQEVSENGVLMYNLSSHIGTRVSRLNPEWNEEADNATVNERFRLAIYLTGSEFHDYVSGQARAWLPARGIVEAAVAARHTVHPSGQIIKLDQFCPWKEHLFMLEEELNIQGAIKFVLFQDKSGTYRVQTVSVDEASFFSSRIPLLEAWRGVRDEALSELLGIPGAVFVHASGFIGGHKTYEGVLEMAARCL